VFWVGLTEWVLIYWWLNVVMGCDLYGDFG